MDIDPGNGYTITIRQVKEMGSPWLVRVHRKRILRKKLISSDWFLSEDQAKQFVKELEQDLRGDAAMNLRTRKPGWTFRRPS